MIELKIAGMSGADSVKAVNLALKTIVGIGQTMISLSTSGTCTVVITGNATPEQLTEVIESVDGCSVESIDMDIAHPYNAKIK